MAGTGGTREVSVDFQFETVPADGTRADYGRSGEFGTSPFLGSVLDKPVLTRT